MKPGERHYNMAKSYPNEEKDAWDVKMLLEVGGGILSGTLLAPFRFLIHGVRLH